MEKYELESMENKSVKEDDSNRVAVENDEMEDAGLSQTYLKQPFFEAENDTEPDTPAVSLTGENISQASSSMEENSDVKKLEIKSERSYVLWWSILILLVAVIIGLAAAFAHWYKQLYHDLVQTNTAIKILDDHTRYLSSCVVLLDQKLMNNSQIIVETLNDSLNFTSGQKIFLDRLQKELHRIMDQKSGILHNMNKIRKLNKHQRESFESMSKIVGQGFGKTSLFCEELDKIYFYLSLHDHNWMVVSCVTPVLVLCFLISFCCIRRQSSRITKTSDHQQETKKEFEEMKKTCQQLKLNTQTMTNQKFGADREKCCFNVSLAHKGEMKAGRNHVDTFLGKHTESDAFVEKEQAFHAPLPGTYLMSGSLRQKGEGVLDLYILYGRGDWARLARTDQDADWATGMTMVSLKKGDKVELQVECKSGNAVLPWCTLQGHLI